MIAVYDTGVTIFNATTGDALQDLGRIEEGISRGSGLRGAGPRKPSGGLLGIGCPKSSKPRQQVCLPKTKIYFFNPSFSDT